ncbi:hypothetical protein SAMN05421684_7584 [Asanoa ishikariensis]|uniref:Uncharacterized protein n=2 Tax=Asanoa ishikariensis TaxID=137265 RepID=A0A1H3UMS8_9ACTN|nr:hypothetical protein SAMN05421684_7584 [Asanoa ishikariensis]
MAVSSDPRGGTGVAALAAGPIDGSSARRPTPDREAARQPAAAGDDDTVS